MERDTAATRVRFDVFATRVIYVLAFVLASVATTQGDFWWLLRAGQDIWTTGHVPTVDHYSYTAAGRYWPNHEWLWESIAYALRYIGGMPLVAAATAVVATSTLMITRRVSDGSGYAVPAVLLVCAAPLTTVWTARPQLTSMLLFAVTMWLLKRERYVILVPLFLLWANLHGQVVMGGILLAAATATAGAVFLVHRDAPSRQRAVRLGLTTTACAVATLCTPLGPRLWTYVLGANSRPGQHEISEWDTAFHVNVVSGAFWALVVVCLVLVVVRRDRLRGWGAVVPVVAAASMMPLGAIAIRNIPFFVLGAMPMLMNLLPGDRPRKPGWVAHPNTVVAVVAGLALIPVAFAWATAPPRLGWHPVSARLATALERCPGHLYNTYNDGASLIWWTPDVKVFVDNRQDPYPAEVLDAGMHLDANNVSRVFDRYRIRCALLPRNMQVASWLEKHAWSVAYTDVDLVLLRKPEVPDTHRLTS